MGSTVQPDYVSAGPNARGGEIRYHDGDPKPVTAADFVDREWVNSQTGETGVTTAADQVPKAGHMFICVQVYRDYRETALADVIDAWGNDILPLSTNQKFTRVEINGKAASKGDLEALRARLPKAAQGNRRDSKEMAAILSQSEDAPF